MKRDINSLDFHKAFTPMPTECRKALLNAVRSVKEETPVKRASLRTVLIAAIFIIITMAVAFAAQQLGWVDFYKDYHGIAMPKEAQTLLEDTEPKTYQVGPMTFTYQQLLADGRIVLSTASVYTTDGTNALYANDTEIFDAVDALSHTIRDLYHLKSGTPWVQAAQQLQLPLYGIRAMVEVDEANSGGEAMSDALWNADGSIVCFNMPATNPQTVKGSLPVTLYMAVYAFEPGTGNELNRWIVEVPIEIRVSEMRAEKTYRPQTDALLTGMTITEVRAEQYATGIYLFISFTTPDGMDEDTAREALFNLNICDGKGNYLPEGINLSARANTDGWPTVVLENMISADTLPDEMIITDGKAEVVVR